MLRFEQQKRVVSKSREKSQIELKCEANLEGIKGARIIADKEIRKISKTLEIK